MRSLLAVTSLALLVATAPAMAQTSDPQPIRTFDLETTAALGRAIYEQDQFAWRGTDALLEAVPSDQLGGSVGWIVVERDGAHIVRFGQGDPDSPSPAYDITFQGDADPVVTEGDGAFSTDEVAMFRALTLARASVTQPCSERYNSVILPDPDGQGWLVWMLAATTDPNVVPSGGHYRFTVSDDGATLEQADRLSRSCLNMSLEAPDGKRPVALMTTQLVAPEPVETFVFLSLTHEIGIFVGTTDGKVWAVEGDAIRLVERD